jgi:predicted AAA+ superfamily ATPase
MSRDLGIAVNTVKAWIGILEASHQLCRVRPFFKNKGKRLVKSPKMYFTDTGFFSYLIGAREPHYAWQGPSAGALLETAVFVELMKCFTNKGRVPSIYFWRTSRGEEIDFIVELGTKLLPLEVKVTQTPSPAAAKNIDGFCELFADESLPGIVVCLTQSRVPLTRHCAAVPFFELADAVESLIK